MSKLAPLAAARVPLLVSYGDADRAVPAEENSEILLSKYAELGAPARTIVRAGADHHPYGIDDVHGGTAVVQEFFEEALRDVGQRPQTRTWSTVQKALFCPRVAESELSRRRGRIAKLIARIPIGVSRLGCSLCGAANSRSAHPGLPG